jgi:hypothetical protein
VRQGQAWIFQPWWVFGSFVRQTKEQRRTRLNRLKAALGWKINKTRFTTKYKNNSRDSGLQRFEHLINTAESFVSANNKN